MLQLLAAEFLAKHYPASCGAILHGSSLTREHGGERDIDLIVVFLTPTVPMREKIEYQGCVFDSLLYDAEALHGAMLIARSSRNFGLAASLAEGAMIAPTAALRRMVHIAKILLAAPPLPNWETPRREALTSIRDSLAVQREEGERLAICAHAFEELLSELSSMCGRPGLSGKLAARRVGTEDPAALLCLVEAFRLAVAGQAGSLIACCDNALVRLGGPVRGGVKIRLPDTLRVPVA